MTALCVVFLIIELAMLAYLINKIRISKSISLKDTLIYPFLFILGAVIIGVARAKYLPSGHWFIEVNYALSQAIDIIRLAVDPNLLHALEDQHLFYYIDYILLYAISALALFSLSLSLVKTAVKNALRLKITQKQINYIFGFNADAKCYISNLSKDERKKTCVVIDEKDAASRHEAELFCDEAKIKYYTRRYNESTKFLSTVKRLTADKAKNYYLLGFFDGDEQLYNFVANAKTFLRERELFGKNVQFIVFASGEQTPFINELIKGKSDSSDDSHGNICAFDKYEIMAYDFIRRHNFAKYFPSSLLNDNCTISDCDINLYMIGFGKVNQALLDDILIQTQFVTVKDKKLTPARMNVTIFDKNEKMRNLNLAYGILKYDKSAYDPEKHFELPESYSSFINYRHGTDIGELHFIDSLYDEIRSRAKIKPQVNYFIVALGSDYTNGLVANKLCDSFELLGDNCHNTYFVRTAKALALPSDRLIYFGDERHILTYGNVVADNIYRAAKIESCIYGGIQTDEKNFKLVWSTLSKIKQKSNLYSIASIPFKLSLLRADFDVTEEQYLKKYDPNNERASYKYSRKLASPSESFSARDVLAFSEHERWCAHELSVGAVPMKKEDCLKFNEADGKQSAVFCNKSKNEIYHLCLTTSKGLCEYHDFVESINKKYGIDVESDVIKYDYDLMDNVLKHLPNLKEN